jgi:hypothetical protein
MLRYRSKRIAASGFSQIRLIRSTQIYSKFGLNSVSNSRRYAKNIIYQSVQDTAVIYNTSSAVSETVLCRTSVVLNTGDIKKTRLIQIINFKAFCYLSQRENVYLDIYP